MTIRASQLDIASPPSNESPTIVGSASSATTGGRSLSLNHGWVGMRKPCRVVSVSDLSANDVYAAGSITAYPAIGATKTASANGALVVDGVTLAVGDRVLLTAEATAMENGIYVVTTAGNGTTPYVITRADDFDEPLDTIRGTRIPIGDEGSYNANKTYALTSTVATPGTDSITLTEVSANLEVMDWKDSVRVATDAALPTNTASGSGPGKTLTASANAALSVDGVAVANGDRVLVKNEVTAANNGIYVVTDKGSATTPYILTRATDADESSNVTNGLTVMVGEGTANSGNGYTLTTADPVTVDTTGLTFTKTITSAVDVTWVVQTIPLSSFTFGTTNSVTLSNTPAAEAKITATYYAVRNGVDDMTNVAISPSNNNEYRFNGNSLEYGNTDQTASGDTIRVYYAYAN